jgi:DNA helicase II / ATP-dependent DNA helicase PcrA
LLAYFQAEIDQGAGLEQAVPSDREAVKLLTVHKAKGLEWNVVFLPALMKGIFPSDRVTDNWVTSAAALPADLRGDAATVPQLAEVTNSAMTAYRERLAEQQLLAEDRLAYVGVTRAKRVLVGSGHLWRPDALKPRSASSYLQAIMAEARRQGRLGPEAGPPAEHNPLVVAVEPRQWPAPLDPDGLNRRMEAAQWVIEARERFAATGSYERVDRPALLLDEEAIVAGWDADLDRLLTEAVEARSGEQTVELPGTLSATAVLRLSVEPDAFAAELARPMPRPPSRAARFGTRFHAWVESHFGSRLSSGPLGQQSLVDPDDLPDRADAGTGDETELREMCRIFLAGRFGQTVPYAIEAPFTLLLSGRLVRGRIDAVYRPSDEGPDGCPFQVVDWKTNRAENADPWQLAIYRLAWAEMHNLPVESVDAIFYYVRSDRVVRPERLPGRSELEQLLSGP